MLTITVDNRLRIQGERLDEHVVKSLTQEFTYSNPDYWKQRALKFKAKPAPRELTTFQRHGGDAWSVPRGGFRRVLDVLDRHSVPRYVDNRTTDGDDSIGDVPPHRVELWDFQREQFRVARARQNGLIRSPAGSGKSTLLLSLISAVNLPSLVIVADLKLVTQWVERVARELDVPKSWVGVIQGSTRRISPVTIAMMQTLNNCVDDYARTFGFVACDEVHRAAASTLYGVLDKMPARYRIGVSDDERRADKKEFLIYDLFGEVISDADYDELVASGVIVDVDFVVHPTYFDVDWWHTIDESARKMAHQKLMDEMEADNDRNALLTTIAHQYATVEKEPTLVMLDRRDHVRAVSRWLGEAGAKSGFILGGTKDKTESDATVRRLREGELQVAVGTYKAVGTGVDLPALARGVFGTPIANSTNGRSAFKQYRGRASRRGKTKAEIAYLWDVKLFGSKPLANLCRWSKRVKVWWNGQLRPGKEVLKEIRDAEQATERDQWEFYPKPGDV